MSAAAEGSNLLSTIAPGTPTPLFARLRFVMLFSRKETSGIPQKSVIMARSSTTLARWLAASPMMSLKPTLCHHAHRAMVWCEAQEGVRQDESEGLGRTSQRDGLP